MKACPERSRRDSDLKAMRDTGLNRIHTGLESGSDKVLKMVKKGATKEMHIKAGLKVKRAGIELSEYYMPGLGGRRLGIFSCLSDMRNPHRLTNAEGAYRELGITSDNVDEIIDQLIKRFI